MSSIWRAKVTSWSSADISMSQTPLGFHKTSLEGQIKEQGLRSGEKYFLFCNIYSTCQVFIRLPTWSEQQKTQGLITIEGFPLKCKIFAQIEHIICYLRQGSLRAVRTNPPEPCLSLMASAGTDGVELTLLSLKHKRENPPKVSSKQNWLANKGWLGSQRNWKSLCRLPKIFVVRNHGITDYPERKGALSSLRKPLNATLNSFLESTRKLSRRIKELYTSSEECRHKHSSN